MITYTPETLTWNEMISALESPDTAALVRRIVHAALAQNLNQADAAIRALCDTINANTAQSFRASTCDQRIPFVDGALSDTQAGAFRRHIGACDDCAQALPRDLQLSSQLDGLADVIQAAAAAVAIYRIDTRDHGRAATWDEEWFLTIFRLHSGSGGRCEGAAWSVYRDAAKDSLLRPAREGTQ